MKITKLLLLAVAIFAFSCSKDDDAEPSLEKKTLSFSESAEVITAPDAMMNSTDPQAMEAATWIDMANQMTSMLAYMQVPEGATKSSSAKITASNGRSQASGDYVVYTWSDDQGTSVAYQISETSDSYAFEIFLIFPDQIGSGWQKYFHAEEKKDRSSGFMKVYDIFGFYGENPSFVLLDYAWTRDGDNLTLTMTDHTEDYVVKLDINVKTKAGSVVYTWAGQKQYEMSWDSEGNGEWTSYDEQGNVSESGTWDV